MACDLRETKRDVPITIRARRIDLSATHQYGLEAGQTNNHGAHEHLCEHAGAEDPIEVVYYGEQPLMTANGSGELLGEATAIANLVRALVVILFAADRDRPGEYLAVKVAVRVRVIMTVDSASPVAVAVPEVHV